MYNTRTVHARQLYKTFAIQSIRVVAMPTAGCAGREDCRKMHKRDRATAEGAGSPQHKKRDRMRAGSVAWAFVCRKDSESGQIEVWLSPTRVG